MFDEASLNHWCSAHGGLHAVRYISMQREKQRRETFLDVFGTRLPSKLHMVDAVDGRKLDPALEGIVDSVSWFMINHKQKGVQIDNIYSIGAVGCAMSHRESIRVAAESPGCTLVMESDMSGINDAAWLRILSDMPVLPEEVDAVWLSWIFERGNGEPTKWSTMERINGMIGGNGAILYTPAGARKLNALLNKNDSVNSRQIDAVFGSVAARYPDDIVMLRTKERVILFDPTSFLGSSIQTADVKPYLPASNWFYITFLVLLLGLVTATVLLGKKLRAQRRRR